MAWQCSHRHACTVWLHLKATDEARNRPKHAQVRAAADIGGWVGIQAAIAGTALVVVH